MRQQDGSTNSWTRVTTAPEAISERRFSRPASTPVRGGRRRSALTPEEAMRSAKPRLPDAAIFTSNLNALVASCSPATGLEDPLGPQSLGVARPSHADESLDLRVHPVQVVEAALVGLPRGDRLLEVVHRHHPGGGVVDLGAVLQHRP